MKISSALLVCLGVSLVGTVPVSAVDSPFTFGHKSAKTKKEKIPANLKKDGLPAKLGAPSPSSGSKHPKIQKPKRVRAPGKEARQIDAGDAKTLQYGVPMVLPSPMEEGDQVSFLTPAPSEWTSVVCFTSAEDEEGDVDLYFTEDGFGDDPWCESASPDNDEECFSLVYPDYSFVVTVFAFATTSDVELICYERPVEDLDLDEDIPVKFGEIRERIYLFYDADELERVTCEVSAPDSVDGDVDMALFSEEPDGTVVAYCESGDQGNNETCVTISVPEPLGYTFVVLTPEFGSLPDGELTLRCEASPLEEIPLGEAVDLEFDTPDGAVAYVVELGNSSSVYCETASFSDDPVVDIDLYMVNAYDDENVCISRGLDASEECSINVEEEATVIVEVFIYAGDTDSEDLKMRCFAGPITELELEDSTSISLEMGDRHVFMMDVGETPSQVLCQLTPTGDYEEGGMSVWMTIADQLIDTRYCATEVDACHLGVFYEDATMQVAVFGFEGAPSDEVTLECVSGTVDVTTLEVGTPSTLVMEDADAAFFVLDLTDISGPTDIACETIVLQGNETDLDLSLSPVGGEYQKTLGQNDLGSSNLLFWPWGGGDATFWVLLEEFDSSKEVLLQCDLAPLDQLVPEVEVTISADELTGNRKPYFLADDPFFGDETRDAKVLYMDDVVDSIVSCNFTGDPGADMFIRSVEPNGRMEELCFATECLVFTSNTTEYVFVSAVANNEAGSDDEYSIICGVVALPDFGIDDNLVDDEVPLPPQDSGDEMPGIFEFSEDELALVRRHDGGDTDPHMFN